MPRKPRATAPAAPDATNLVAVRHTVIAADDNAARLESLRPTLGALVDMTTDRLWGEVDLLMSRTSEDMLQLGLRLLALKEKLPHGDFGPEVEKRGISWFTANKFMRAAFKLADATNLKQLSRSRIIELTVLDQDEIAELDKGGTVAGLEIDDIRRMSILDLRHALREERDNRAADEERIADKDKKINELDKKLRRLPDTQEWPKLVVHAIDDVRKQAKEAASLLISFKGKIEHLEAMMAEHTPTTDQASLTADEAINCIHALVNVLGATQSFAYEAFERHTHTKYTITTPQGDQHAN